MNQVVRKFEVIEGGSLVGPHSGTNELPNEPLMNPNFWVTGQEISELSGVSYRAVAKGVAARRWRGADLEVREVASNVGRGGKILQVHVDTRELMQGVGGDSMSGGFDVPALATVAAAGSAGVGPGNVTFAPQYNMPLSFAPGVDVEEVRETVREELMEAEERARADMRGNLYD